MSKARMGMFHGGQYDGRVLPVPEGNQVWLVHTDESMVKRAYRYELVGAYWVFQDVDAIEPSQFRFR